MKKMFVFMLAMVMLLAAVPAHAAGPGIWEVREYVDEFELPTGDTYISNRVPFVGKFNNSATTGSPLKVYLYYDDEYVWLRMFEYETYLVKNSFSKTEEYQVSLMDPQGQRYSLTGFMFSKSDRLSFDEKDSKTIVEALCQNGLVRFAIQGDNSKYLFNVTDSTGFSEMIYGEEALSELPFNSLFAFSDGLAWGEKKDKWGAVDATGQVVIPFEYDFVNSFQDGLALVKKGETLQYIDKAGNIVIPCTWDSANNFSSGYAAVKKADLWGVIDTTGTLVIPCEWDSVGRFSEGLFNVKKDGKYGYIDAAGKVVIPCEWDVAGVFSDGLALVKKANKYGFIDAKGKLVIPCKWEGASSFSEGLACVKKGNKFGFIDIKGKLIIPCEWEYAGSFSEGMAYVLKNGKYGYVNPKGKLAIPCQWEDAGSFSEGLACITKGHKSGYIDKTGKLVIPCSFGAYPGNFSEGFAPVRDQNEDRVMIDTTGRIVIK